MKFSLIVCTYQRPGPLLKLLASVQEQTIYPNQIVIVDGSLDTKNQDKLRESPCKNLEYFLVDAKNRGLTKQRNFGIQKISEEVEVVCFLDCLLYTSPSPRDQRGSRMPSSA